MAVYTNLSAADFSALLRQYDVGEIVSAKGIAEGVSNSNWLIETTQARFILTMYEHRVDLDDLPFFLGLLDHLAAKGSPVPRTIHDKAGAAFRMMDGKAVALIEFLSGVSVDRPNAAQAYAVGSALAGLHINAADFPDSRPNSMGLAAWHSLFADCGEDGLRKIDPALPAIVAEELAFLDANWPQDLPRSVIHADLFPDNVLMLDNHVSGLIDFYFACTDITAYDLAVTHAAWCFTPDGSFQPEIARELMRGYTDSRPLSDAEQQALPLLARGATLRFMATRAYDWLNTPVDALVTPKDPMDFARRLAFYREQGEGAFPARQSQGID
ncbi:homoserine kinase type II [Altererythrobacter atlanticus]|uniref:Homoserine kinase n=1 Tax=Croceibacterium atlanticum TaxID=1267766 RepID=A0A0F7KUI2_9SPHN|nr:homoserine kinase [Croceibacterium atlanticum]AKH42435.1 Homoserine kinase [Croceibacterium atlanticum]MBB5731212.1 homoserine kinase type II [Croceibacterium atlanticum]